MSRHRLQHDLSTAPFVLPIKIGPAGNAAIGFGTTTPSDEGWAPGARFFILTAPTAGAATSVHQYVNTGTATTAVWKGITETVVS